jgi:hypothetical protein
LNLLPGQPSDLELLHRQILSGSLSVQKLKRFLKGAAPEVLLQPLAFAEGRSLLQENVLHQNKDNNPSGRLALTCEMAKLMPHVWREHTPPLEQPLAWLLAGILPSASIPHVYGGVELLNAVFPQELPAPERQERWRAVMDVLTFVWENEPVRASAPLYEFNTWWKYVAFDLAGIIPKVNEHEAQFMTAWKQAHGSPLSEGAFLGHALDVLNVQEQYPDNDPGNSPFNFLAFSPVMKEPFQDEGLQEAVVVRLQRSAQTAKERLIQTALALQWWAWAPVSALSRHAVVSKNAGERLLEVDHQKSADESLVMQAMEEAFAAVKGLPAPIARGISTMMSGPMQIVPLRYTSLTKQWALEDRLPTPIARRPSPRF